MILMAGGTMLKVELCGRLADGCGPFVDVVIPQNGCSAAEVLSHTAEQHPVLAAPLASNRVKACVNETVVPPEASVAPDDLVALFPPVSGG
ncbi:MAG: MoaD/ThiS family protein [Sphingomonadales bacterium]|nr:MAG: MoaD/ThiS family protein [Sphingomonadales bacterium]